MIRPLALLLTLTAGAAAPAAPMPDLTITRHSAGPVRLGMTLAQLRSAGLKIQRTSDGEGVALVRVSRGGKEWMTVYAGEPDPARPLSLKARVEHIEVTSPEFRTAAGVRPGMRLPEVVRRYGRLVKIERSEIESREYATFARAPQGFTFRVTGPEGAAGVYGSGATTRKTVPGARLASIIIAGR
jgi:hypothetical protein